ncbi:DUF1615 domain-containing protein [Crenobacter intestini]|uniref:DUF1615 domain-containing protein n=1 Tax=Crenobacter intestini TaxID=2563443 RepID=A0A4T0UXN4_9NEIS|nr:DUF1615 domain-containing protein [Crenobacter intestini]TIC83667.1 DUF1615 domain-containing protein [Crenobacter intestini]
MNVRAKLSLLAPCVLLAACSSVKTPAPVVVAPPPSSAVEIPVPMLPPPAASVPVVPPPAPVVPARISEAEARALAGRLLPAGIRDRDGWRDEMVTAFGALKIPYSKEHFCAAIAVIEQESSWQADPVVPGLPGMVWAGIEKKASPVPMALVKAALLKPSRDGRSYKARIDSLRTEREVSELFDELSGEARRLSLPVGMGNPVRTGGPMQVSVAFAEAQLSAWPHYPYPRAGSVRAEVFTRRGGLYFGIANLLQYPVNYSEMKYRFADFNAGRYSSRNAAFQQLVSRLSGRALSSDGDLLSYRGAQALPSETQFALEAMGSRLGLSRDAIARDLRQEKFAAFAQTELYRRVYALADVQGLRAPREAMPQIALKSPKITRKLTTEWFAGRVDGRYRTCLQRVP